MFTERPSGLDEGGHGSAGSGEPQAVSKHKGNGTSFAVWQINSPIVVGRT